MRSDFRCEYVRNETVLSAQGLLFGDLDFLLEVWVRHSRLKLARSSFV